MKVGIIVYSKTGNTLSVAKSLKEKLTPQNNVNIEVVEVSGNPEQGMGKFKLEYCPSIKEYDYIIFGSPVNAFSLCPVMISYLNQIENLNNKKVSCFVTQFFPFPFLGGNRAIKQMVELCEKKEGHIIKTGVINWSSKKREDKIITVVNDIVRSLDNR